MTSVELVLRQMTDVPELSVYGMFEKVKELILSGTVKETRVFQYYHFQNKIFDMLKKDKQTKSAFDSGFDGYGKGQFVLDGFICNKYDRETGVDFSQIKPILEEKAKEPLSEDDLQYLQMQLEIVDTYQGKLKEIEEAKQEVKKMEEYFRQNLSDCVSVKHATVIEISTKRAI